MRKDKFLLILVCLDPMATNCVFPLFLAGRKLRDKEWKHSLSQILCPNHIIVIISAFFFSSNFSLTLLKCKLIHVSLSANTNSFSNLVDYKKTILTAPPPNTHTQAHVYHFPLCASFLWFKTNYPKK